MTAALDWSSPSGWTIGQKCEVLRSDGVWERASVIGGTPTLPKVLVDGTPYWFLVLLAREIRPLEESHETT